MGFFDFLKPKKKLLPEQLRWNKMWTLWCRGEADSPYAELMTYLGEVTNGGHSQYFTNTVFLKADMEVLDTALPPTLRDNLHTAYAAYQADDDEILARCDAFFTENEDRVNDLLKEYAQRLSETSE